MRLIFRAGECPNGPCESIYDTDDGRIAVQGPVLADPAALHQLTGMPSHESVVLISPALLEAYLRNPARLR